MSSKGVVLVQSECLTSCLLSQLSLFAFLQGKPIAEEMAMHINFSMYTYSLVQLMIDLLTIPGQKGRAACLQTSGPVIEQTYHACVQTLQGS